MAEPENTQLFNEPETEEVQTTEELFSDPQFPQSIQQSQVQVKTTAKLAAIAEKDDDPSIQFDELVRQNEELINLGEEQVIRREASLRDFQNRTQAVDTLAFSSLAQGSREDAAAVLELDPALSQINEKFNAVEIQAVEKLQNTELTQDLDYGAEIQALFAEDTGSSIDLLRDEVGKTLVYQRKLDEYRESIKRRGFDKLFKRTGDIGAMFLPLYDTQSRINVRTNDDGTVEVLDLISAGKTVRRQIEGLWALPFDQFVEEVDLVFENAESQSGLLGTNELAALNILEQYAKGTQGLTGVLFDDTVGFIDSIPVAGTALRLVKRGVISTAGIAKISGARRTAVTLNADELLKTRKTGEALVEEAGEDAVQAMEALIPSHLKPSDALDQAGDVKTTTRTKETVTRPNGTVEETEIITEINKVSDIGISGSLAAKLQEIEEIGDAISNITTQGRLSDDQMALLMDKQIENIVKNTSHRIEDIKRRVEPDTKLGFVDVYIGKKDGGSYATANAAKGAAKRRGFESFDIAEENGHFFIRQSHVTEELAPNGMPKITKPDNSIEVIPATGPIRAFLANPDRSLPVDLATRRHEAELASIKFREKVVKPLEKIVGVLNKNELRSLEVVMTKGRNEKRWFQVDEFAGEWKKVTGKDPKEFHFAAYAAAIKGNNVDHQIRNLHLYTERARRGMKTVSIKNSSLTLDKVNGKELPLTNFDELVKSRMYDVEDGIYRTGKDVSPEEVAELRRRFETGDVKIIRLEESVRIAGDPVDTVIVRGTDATIEPLSRQQLAYVPGGHLLRRTPWFGKQARRGIYKDGQEYVDAPSTLFAYRTEGSGVKHLGEINDTLAKYKAFLDTRTVSPSIANAKAVVNIRRVIAESPFESLENLEDLVSKGKIDPGEPIELVFDRGLPEKYWKNENLLGNPNIHKLFDGKQDIIDGTTQWTRTNGRDYYGKRTDGLISPHEDKDVVLDPLASISRGLENAVKTHAFDNYITRSIEEWVRQAAPFIEVKSLAGSNDFRAAFYSGKLTDQLRINNPNVFNKLEQNRNILKDTLGLQTQSQEVFSAAKRNLARFVEGAGRKNGVLPAGIANPSQLVMKIDDISSNNPINALNGMVFDAWLGMGDLSQLWVQTQTLLTAVAASPKFGAQALGMLYPMRLMMINKSDNLLDYVAKTAKGIHKQDPEDFKNMIRAYRESGWNAPGGELAYLANHSNSIGSAGVVANINKGRRALRLPFNEAERLNRIGAWQIAWKETIERFPKLDRTGEEFLATVTKRTSDYSLNMTAASNSRIQKGIFSPMTRFMGYQMRMLEAILPKVFGGGSQFTAGQKSRIWASQVFLYGAKGLPFGNKIDAVAEDLFEQATGERMTAEQSKFLESGAIDSILFAISGGDLNTDLAERAGFGRGLDYTFERASDGSMASALAAYGGPTYAFSSRYAESVRRVMTYFKGTRGPLELDAEDAKFVANELFVKHVNFTKRIDKARMIWRLGMVVDQRTGRPLFDATELEGAAAFLGVPLFEETKLFQLYDELEDHDREVKFNGQLLAKLDREAFRLMSEGEWEKADLNMKQAAIILSQFQDDPRTMQQVASFATNELGFTGTQWESLLQRIQTRLGPDALPPEGLRYEEGDEDL